jgi:hypothetical protein
MTDQNSEDQGIELHDDENEIMEAQGHDPANAEAQSVASVDKADDSVKQAPLPSQGTAKNNTTKDPMPKTKAGMINAMTMAMQGRSKTQLAQSYNGMMKQMNASYHVESVETEETELQYQADFSQDLNALVESEATLSDEFKTKAETIFEAAIKHKLSEEIDRLEAKYEEELSEEIESTKADLVEKVDSYLNYVVENWMEENQVAIQAGLRTEIAENFMQGMKTLFEESYIEVPESKVDLVDELADTVEDLEEQLNATTGKVITMAEELEMYKRDAIIRESSRDLAETQVEKLKSLVENIDFEDEETFAQKVETVKESYFTKTSTESTEADYSQEEDGNAPVVTSGSMSSYLAALEKTAK